MVKIHLLWELVRCFSLIPLSRLRSSFSIASYPGTVLKLALGTVSVQNQVGR